MVAGEVLNLIRQAKDLPTLPTVAARVVDLTAGKEASVKEVANLIEKDMALSSKLLQIINSPFYGFSRGITSVSEAVSLMGFKQVGNLALGLSVMGSLSQGRTYGFSFEDFWEHAVGNAVAAVMITSHVRAELSHSIFTAALLQNIGTCLLVRYLPMMYGYASAVSRARGIHIVHAEQEVLGTDHAEVGMVLAEGWNLPSSMGLPIRYHHFSEFGDNLDVAAVSGEMRTAVKAVNLSNLLTDVLYEEDKEVRTALAVKRAGDMFGIGREPVEAILQGLPEEIEQIKSLFEVEESQPAAHAATPSPDAYYEECPVCGSKEGTKFCGNCGMSLARLRMTEAEAGSGRPKKVLIAEDSAATRTAIGNMLKRMGYQVVAALNGEEAVEIARKESPELILLDIMMPVMDGIEALKRIRSNIRLRATPVVMLTSVTDIRMVTEAIECGANDYIAKPFSVSLLTERVERYIHAR